MKIAISPLAEMYWYVCMFGQYYANNSSNDIGVSPVARRLRNIVLARRRRRVLVYTNQSRMEPGKQGPGTDLRVNLELFTQLVKYI